MAELLTRYGFRGTFFATTGPDERDTASTEELRAIVRLGHEIGNHGVSHRSLTELSTAAIVEDAHLGAELCETFMRRVSPIIAPPRGHLDGRVLATLHQEALLVRTAPIVGRARPADGTVEPTVHLFAHSLYRTVGHLLRRRAVPEAGLVRPLAGLPRTLEPNGRHPASICARDGAASHMGSQRGGREIPVVGSAGVPSLPCSGSRLSRCNPRRVLLRHPSRSSARGPFHRGTCSLTGCAARPGGRGACRHGASGVRSGTT